jgi:ABC-type polysaccharide/polyol phosphate transport system ATPase subunit
MQNLSVAVGGVSLMYNLSREREERLKEYVINMLRGKLYFDPFWALQDISFSLAPGDSLGIVGENGAGKSSLLKIISGIIQPTKGTVYTKGVIAPMVELGGGFDGTMTARQNILFMGAMHGFSKKYMQERCEDIIRFAELEEFADVSVNKFSSGMK